MSTELKPTPEQDAILSAVGDSAGPSVMVEAGAGCAKTSTLTMASNRVKVPGLAIAFNKSIAVELEKRMPGNFSCKTMNGLGHGAWARARGLKGNGLKLEPRKVGLLVTEMAKKNKTQLNSEQWDYAKTLVREAQIQGLVPEPFGSQFTTLVPDTEEGWQSLSDVHAIPDDDFEMVWEISRDALIEDIKQAFLGTVSFDDQIYCSTLLGGQFPQFPVVFVDEDQDLSPLQIRMISQSIHKDGRILAVGDKCQSIYAFRGAVGQAAEQIRALRSSWIDLPLMTSFRVPQLVADRQRGHVPLFRAHGANPTGQISVLGGNTDSAGWTFSDITNRLPDNDTQIAILCRNNAPLMSMAFKLIRQGIGCHVLGRDISKGLVALTKKLFPENNTPANIIMQRLHDWLESETSKAHVSGNPEAADKFTDKADSIAAIMESAECQNAGQLRDQIERLFSRESGLVTLSTIHKAKGLEWGAVMHLDPFRLPSKFAVKAGGRALEQEKNLRYVCETRTKHTLLFAKVEGFQ